MLREDGGDDMKLRYYTRWRLNTVPFIFLVPLAFSIPELNSKSSGTYSLFGAAWVVGH